MKEATPITIGNWRKKRLDHISATGTIQTYLECPLQFWFNKIAKFPSDDDKPWLIFGTAIHAAQEYFMKDYADGKGKSSKSIEGKMYSEYDKEMVIGGSKTKPDRFWGDGGIEDLNNKAKILISKSVKRYNKLKLKPLIVEGNYNIKYDDYLTLTGKVDLVVETTKEWEVDGLKIKPGSILLLDHKTASQKYKTFKVHLAPQLTFYSYLLRNIEYMVEDYVGYQTFMKYKEPLIIDYMSKRTDLDMQIMKETIDRIATNIYNGVFYPTYTVDVCNWCNHRQVCKKYSLEDTRLKCEKEKALEEGFKLNV